MKISQHRGYDASIPFGACSVWHRGKAAENPTPHIICPSRFIEGGRIFRDASAFLERSEARPAFVVPGVDLPLGRLDYVLCTYNAVSHSVEDFCALEVMACSTTSTGEVLRSFHAALSGQELREPLGYGINFRQIISRMVVQGLAKAQAFGFWGKTLVWGIQDALYSYMTAVSKLDMPALPFPAEQSSRVRPPIVLLVYTMEYAQSEGRFRLALGKVVGGTVRDFPSLLEPRIHLGLEALATALGQRIAANDRIFPLR